MIKPATFIKHWLYIAVLLLIPAFSQAQSPSKSALSTLIANANQRNDSLAIERIYLHTDKESYVAGDTLWFKAYIFNATLLTPSLKSGLMYLELSTDSNRMVRRIMLPVINGLTMGKLSLADIPQGQYLLRAYTNWMQNFKEEFISRKAIYISDADNQPWLVRYNTQSGSGKDGNNINFGVGLNKFDKTAISFKDLQVRVTDGRKNLLRVNLQTTAEGTFNVALPVDDQAVARLSMVIEEKNKDQAVKRLTVPLKLNRPEKMDLQFMPEGGNLVAGLSSNVAFKAVGEDGKGMQVAGMIRNSKGENVAAFKSSYKGIGTFSFIPKPGEQYTAVVEMPGNTFRSYALPAVAATGIVMTINNPLKGDSCFVSITATDDIVASKQSYYLVGRVRSGVYYGAFVNFSKGPAKIKFSKQNFPAGVLHLTLLTTEKRALNERLVYIDRKQLFITATAGKTTYGLRDSVSLKIKATDKDGSPVMGTFSVAVTDDGQVKRDSLNDLSIVHSTLLTADLEGYVEDPGYYLGDNMTETRWKDLDNLLLAQGWVEYSLEDAFKPVKLPFAAETDFLVKGKVTNMLNRPVASATVTLFSKRPLLITDTVTDAKGNFVFKNIYSVDTAAYFLSTKNKRNKSGTLGIEMETFNPPVFKLMAPRATPWFVNIDTGAYRIVKNQTAVRDEQDRLMGRNRIAEVVITGKKVVKDSKNLNGPGVADVTIDEKELAKEGKASLEDLIKKRVKGFEIRIEKDGKTRNYKITGSQVHLIIDGINTEFFKPDDLPLYDFQKDFFDYYDAEEIKGIEVMFAGGNSMRYTTEFLPPNSSVPYTFFEHAYIEVTTRSGKGPFMHKATGTYLYKPMPFSSITKFYAPVYTPGDVATGADARATIHWDADVVTNKDGEATVKFYTADYPGRYTIVINGADMQGNVATTTGHLSVIRKQPAEKTKSNSMVPKRYIFYLHNKFNEDNDLNAVNKDYGKAAYIEMTDKLKSAGLEVISEKRPAGTDASVYAEKVKSQVEALLRSGVPAHNITIFGISKGGYIAQFASSKLANPDLNFVFVACYTDDDLVNLPDINWCGNILYIYETSDSYGVDATARAAASKLKINNFTQLKLDTGLKHGFIYQPMEEWMAPAIAWASRSLQ